MSDYIEWKPEDLKRFGIKEGELPYYLRAGLQPFSKEAPEVRLPCPKVYHAYYQPCLFFNFPDKFMNALLKMKKEIEKLGKDKTYVVKHENSVYGVFYKAFFSANKRLKNGDDLPITYDHIKRVQEIISEDYVEYKEKMGRDPADKETLESWRYIPHFEKEIDKGVITQEKVEEVYELLLNYIKKKAVFKEDQVIEIKGQAPVEEKPTVKSIQLESPSHLGETPATGWEEIAKCAGWSESKAKKLRQELLAARVIYYEKVGTPPRKRVRAWPSDIKSFTKAHANR